MTGTTTNTRWMRGALAAGLVCAVAATAVAAPTVGEEAPELEVTEWIQGEEIKLAENPDGRVRVLEFFNAFDQGCSAAVPDLEKLHLELGPKGVDLVAITTQGKSVAEDFVANRELTFRVAVDSYNNTNAAYMGDGTRPPHCFVIDQKGLLAWSGAPGADLRKVVEEVLAGTFDVERAARISALTIDLVKALGTQEPDAMGTAADALLAEDPGNDFALQIRLQVFQRKDDPEGYHEWMREYLKSTHDDADVQSSMAWRLLSRGDFKWRNPELAHAAAARAVELTESKDADKLDTYARALFEVGLLEDAIREAKKSVGIEDAESAKDRLAHYEACLAARKKIQKKKR